MLKKSGSTYVYIKEAYSFGHKKPWMDMCGSLLSFVFVWTDVMIGQPLGSAIILLTMGQYICRAFFIDCQDMPENAVKCFALFALSKSTIYCSY